MNFIQNVSWADIVSGRHMDAGDRGVLIQIGDPLTVFPRPKVKFATVHQFEFLDIDDTHTYKGNTIIPCQESDEWEFRITEQHAKDIIEILKRALDGRRNVIVHCHAGICRSGAVAEVGEMMGYASGGTFRLPNILVKKLLMQELGWTYENN